MSYGQDPKDKSYLDGPAVPLWRVRLAVWRGHLLHWAIGLLSRGR